MALTAIFTCLRLGLTDSVIYKAVKEKYSLTPILVHHGRVTTHVLYTH